jgi:hypothetical protein
MPPAAKAHTKAGAEAFVRAYFAEVNRAWTTPASDGLATYAKPSCKSCAAVLSTANRLVAKKQHYAGNPVTLKSVMPEAELGTSRYQVSISAVQEKRDVLDTRGTVVLTDQHKSLGFTLALDWRNAHWSIETIRRSA